MSKHIYQGSGSGYMTIVGKPRGCQRSRTDVKPDERRVDHDLIDVRARAVASLFASPRRWMTCLMHRSTRLLVSTQPLMHMPELVVALGIATVLMLLLLPSQLRVGNVAILALIFGTLFVNLAYLINMCIWATDVRNVAPVWCDIGASPAYPAQTKCIYGHDNYSHHLPILLCNVSGRRRVVHLQTSSMDFVTTQHRLKQTSPEAVRNHAMLCPTTDQHTYPYVFSPNCQTYGLTTFAGYTLASNRFAILEGFGCLPLFHLSPLSIVFIGGPDILIGAISFVVAGNVFLILVPITNLTANPSGQLI